MIREEMLIMQNKILSFKSQLANPQANANEIPMIAKMKAKIENLKKKVSLQSHSANQTPYPKQTHGTSMHSLSIK